MRLLSYVHDGRPGFGVVDASGAGVIDLAPRFPDIADLSALLDAGALDVAGGIAVSDTADRALDDLCYRRTIPRPRKIFCIGVNYGGRNAEYRDGTDGPAKPSVFVRFPDSLVGHHEPLVRPPESDQLDYEGEVVAVIGTGGRRIPRREARRHLAGLTLGNEGTIRDWVRHAKFNVTQGKNWEASGSMGPWLVTMDEIGDLDDLHLTTTVNGDLRQDDTTASMAFPIEYQIEYLSTFCTLEPGDVIFTGTPTGAGARFDPPRFLTPGDVVEVHEPSIGTLRNPVVDEGGAA